MAFKMRGFNPGAGTGMNSAFKQTDKAYGGTRTWKEGEESAGRHDANLNKLVTERGKHEKGSAEYNIAQNKINQALGSTKRHGDETAHRITETDKKSTVVHKTPEGEKHKTSTTYGGEGNVEKEKQLKKDEKGTKKTVVKFGKEGEVVGERGYSTGEYKKEDKAQKKADKDAAKAQKKADKDAAKAQKKADKDAKKAAKKAKREAKKNK